jgi:mono/diheme cytochrome c family protein
MTTFSFNANKESCPMQKHLAHYGIISLLSLAASASCLAQNSGADIYKSKCQMCHGVDGSGNTPAGKAFKAHPFNSPDVLKESDADLTTIIKDGKNKMPAFSGKLTAAQITDVLGYIHTLQKK